MNSPLKEQDENTVSASIQDVSIDMPHLTDKNKALFLSGAIYLYNVDAIDALTRLINEHVEQPKQKEALIGMMDSFIITEHQIKDGNGATSLLAIESMMVPFANLVKHTVGENVFATIKPPYTKMLLRPKYN